MSDRENIKRAFGKILQNVTEQSDQELEVRFHNRFNRFEEGKFQSNIHPSVFRQVLDKFEKGEMKNVIRCETTDYTDKIFQRRSERLIYDHTKGVEYFIEKRPEMLPPPFNCRQYINEKGFKIALSSEREIDSEEQKEKFISHFEKLSEKERMIRKKHRKTFVQTLNDNSNNSEVVVFRFDFTIVDSNHYSDPRYEIEMEYIGNRENKPKFKSYILQQMDLLSELFLDNLETLLRLIQDSLVFMTWNDHNKVIQNYQRTLNISPKEKDFFKGTQPETLHKKDLQIVKNNEYFVTYKSDGKRGLLFVDSDSTCYIIERFMHIIKTESQLKGFEGSVFDGEWFVNGKVFEIFDLLCLNRKDMRDKLSCERFSTLESIKGKILSQNIHTTQNAEDYKIEVLIKKHELLKANTLDFGLIESIYKSKQRFEIDGLIFTPSRESYPNRRKWQNLLKWKPPHLNSIDLFVEKDEIEANKWNLFVHSVLVRDKEGKEGTLLKKNRDTVQFVYNDTGETKILPYSDAEVFQNHHIKILFPYYPHLVTLDDNLLKNNQVIEFIYQKDDNMMVPIRIRYDKSSENYLGSNFISVACDIWSTMVDPVELNNFNLEGYQKRKSANAQKQEDLYIFKFHNGIKRTLLESVSTQQEFVDFKTVLKKFDPIYDSQRGHWIIRREQESIDMLKFLPVTEFYEDETSLYLPLPESMKIDKHAMNLLDMCTGKGGDMWKWCQNDIKNIIGIDNERFLLLDAEDSAINRWRGIHNKFPNTSLYFVEMDCRMRIYDYLKSKNLTHDFDIVSCFFAIHYFFGSTKDVFNIMTNIKENLQYRGYFIGTVLDGEKVFQLLREHNGKYVIKNDKKEDFCTITQKYDDQGKDLSQLATFGLEVDVNISNSIIDEYIDISTTPKIEYLVNFKKFEEVARHFDLELVDSKTFDKYKGFDNLSESEKELSRLYRTFIFKKKSNSLLELNKEMIDVSEFSEQLRKLEKNQLTTSNLDRLIYSSTNISPDSESVTHTQYPFCQIHLTQEEMDEACGKRKRQRMFFSKYAWNKMAKKIKI